VGLEVFIVLSKGESESKVDVPSEIENITDLSRIGKILYFRRVEEYSHVGIFLVRIEIGNIELVINYFDFFNKSSFLLVEVGIGGIDDEASGAGLVDLFGIII